MANPTHPLFCLRNIWRVPYDSDDSADHDDYDDSNDSNDSNESTEDSHESTKDSNAICPNCNDNSLGSYYCKTCDVILCDRCYETHSKLKITCDHDVITIQ